MRTSCARTASLDSSGQPVNSKTSPLCAAATSAGILSRTGVRAPCRLFQVEDFPQHGEALPGLFVRDRLKEAAHKFLPPLIDGVAIQLVPGVIEIRDAQRKDQVLSAPEDRIVGD